MKYMLHLINLGFIDYVLVTPCSVSGSLADSPCRANRESV